MAEILHDKELISFKEMLMANSIQMDALSQLLIEKKDIYTGRVLHQTETGSDGS